MMMAGLTCIAKLPRFLRPYHDLGCGVQGLGPRIQGSGLGIQGLGLSV